MSTAETAGSRAERGAALARPLRSPRLGHTVLWRDRVDSTNAWVRRLAERGAPEGVLALAGFQSQGRGRLGRRWESPPALGLYCSVLLRPRLPAERLGILSLASGVAAAGAVRSLCKVPVLLQWPNDLMVGGRKLGGILVETSFQGSRLRFAVAGWGLNLTQRRSDFSPELRRRATSLRLEGVGAPESAELAGAFAARLQRLLARLEAGGGRGIARLFRSLAPGARAGTRLRLEVGGRLRRAVCRGLAQDGALRVELVEGERLLRGTDQLRVLGARPVLGG